MTIKDSIGYDVIIENSMRMVIYHTLKKIEKKPIPDKHYFVISFLTEYPGVLLSKELKEKYQDEMSIVIQYQYYNLVVDKDHFSIELSFSGVNQKIKVPYDSVTSFADPSVNFALKFGKKSRENKANLLQEDLSDSENYNESNSENNKIDLSSKVISLDAFRKQKDKE
jgi:hypothetical protein